jgi:seryl-tRNA synthetase
MIDINAIRTQPELFRAAIRRKRINVDLDGLLDADKRRRDLQFRVDALRSQRNQLSAQIKQKLQEGDSQNVRGSEQKRSLTNNKFVEEGRRLDHELSCLEPQLKELERQMNDMMLHVPSLPADDVPDGNSDEDNQELYRWGVPHDFAFTPKDHIEIMRDLNMVLIDQAREIAGSRSYALIGIGALLELAVLRFALDFTVARGFVPVAPPVMANERAMTGTGYFPIGRENAYNIERDQLYLSGTSEVAVVALQANQTFKEEELPKRYVGISACFRREAGAAGKDTRGLYRVHQFQKVEQVVFSIDDDARCLAEHRALLSNAEELLQALQLPYRVVAVCAGELGLGQVRKHDIETWMPSRASYGETHSCSTLSDFQARRLNIRYLSAEKKRRYVHTLNNTAIASPRILIAILENHQNADGSINIPVALQPYMGGLTRINSGM